MRGLLIQEAGNLPIPLQSLSRSLGQGRGDQGLRTRKQSLQERNPIFDTKHEPVNIKKID
jgi:hypothetical protein